MCDLIPKWIFQIEKKSVNITSITGTIQQRYGQVMIPLKTIYMKYLRMTWLKFYVQCLIMPVNSKIESNIFIHK